MHLPTRLPLLAGYLSILLVLPCPRIADAAATCAASPEEAAITFHRSIFTDPRSTLPLLNKREISGFRRRLLQVLDDRYSPMSSQFRERILGPEWPLARLRGLGDAELVAQYFATSKLQSAGVELVSIDVTGTKPSRDYAGDDAVKVTVSYQVRGVKGNPARERTVSARPLDGCWVLDVPLATWAQLEGIATELKGSRKDAMPYRQGPSRVPLQVAAASATARPGMRATRRRGSGTTVWVDETPLLTDADIIRASASWDCQAQADYFLEDPAVRIAFREEAAHRLTAWSGKNVGSMLAIVIDGEVVMFARVAEALGNRVSACMTRARLEDAEALARALIGVPEP